MSYKDTQEIKNSPKEFYFFRRPAELIDERKSPLLKRTVLPPAAGGRITALGAETRYFYFLSRRFHFRQYRFYFILFHFNSWKWPGINR